MMQLPCPLCHKSLIYARLKKRYECKTEIYDAPMMGCVPHYIIHVNGDISIRVGTYWILHTSENNIMTICRTEPRDSNSNRMQYKLITEMEAFEVKSEEQVIKKIDLIRVFL